MHDNRNYKIDDSDYKYSGDVKRIDPQVMMSAISSYRDQEDVNVNGPRLIKFYN